MTAQISSSVRMSSHTGIALFQGAPSLGRPGPPLAIRQNTKLSVSCGIVPESLKGSGAGVKPCAKWPRPSSPSPWQGRQFW